MEAIGAYDAKTHLPQLLDQVASHGASYVITKHGRPVAHLVPVNSARAQAVDVIARLREARQGVLLDGLDLSELIAEGRR